MASTAINSVGGGHIKDKFDARDHYYISDPNTQPPESVNLRKDHLQLVSEIYDQGATNTCTANATAAAFWYEEKVGRRDQAWGEAGPSRLFIYWLARGAYKNADYDIRHPHDFGSSPRDAIKGVAKVGPALTFDNADPHKISAFYRLDPARPDSDDHKLSVEDKDKIGAALLDNLRKCLTEQYPVIFGFSYYLPIKESFDESEAPFVLKDVWQLADKKFPRHTFAEDLPDELRIREKGEVITPRHTVLAIGYDDKRQQVLLQNSWGSKWSGNGTFWMPYSYITDFAASNDFWTVRSSSQDLKVESKLWEDVHNEILSK